MTVVYGMPSAAVIRHSINPAISLQATAVCTADCTSNPHGQLSGINQHWLASREPITATQDPKIQIHGASQHFGCIAAYKSMSEVVTAEMSDNVPQAVPFVSQGLVCCR